MVSNRFKMKIIYFFLILLIPSYDSFAGIKLLKPRSESNFSFAKPKSYIGKEEVSAQEFKNLFSGDTFVVSLQNNGRFNLQKFNIGRLISLAGSEASSNGSEDFQRIYTISSFFYWNLSEEDNVGLIKIPDGARIKFDGYNFSVDKFIACGKIKHDRLHELVEEQYKEDYRQLMSSEIAQTYTSEVAKESALLNSEPEFESFMETFSQKFSMYLNGKPTDNPAYLFKVLNAYKIVTSAILNHTYHQAFSVANKLYFGASLHAVDPVVQFANDWQNNAWYWASCLLGSVVQESIYKQENLSFDERYNSQIASSQAVNYITSSLPHFVLSLEVLEGAASEATSEIYEEAKLRTHSDTAFDIALVVMNLCEEKSVILGRTFYRKAQRNALISLNENLDAYFDSALEELDKVQFETSKSQLQEIINKIDVKILSGDNTERQELMATLLSPCTVILKNYIENLDDTSE